jgi:ankyrin repeat protein
MAFIGGHAEVAAFLVDLGADVNARTAEGSPPLGGAAMSGHTGLVALLLDHGADIELTNTAGMTSLVAAISGLSDEWVDLLVERGASVDVRDGGGFAPIHHAASLGRDGALRSIAAAGGDIDSTTEDGGTALVLATMRRQADTVAVLLELGADPTISVGGRTALDVARRNRDARIERLLTEAIAARQAGGGDGAGRS